MMGKICIHNEDEIPSCMFNAVNVGSALKGTEFNQWSTERNKKHCNELYPCPYLGLTFLLWVVEAKTNKQRTGKFQQI